MIKYFHFIGLLLYHASSSTILEYEFSINFGKKFHDYSNNGYDGINGYSISSNNGETTATDRGAYFSSDGSQIQVSDSSKNMNNFTLQGNFSILS